METWLFIALLVVFNSIFGVIYSLVVLKRGNRNAYQMSMAENKIALNDASFGDYLGYILASFIGGLFTLRNLLFSPISIALIYFIK